MHILQRVRGKAGGYMTPSSSSSLYPHILETSIGVPAAKREPCLTSHLTFPPCRQKTSSTYVTCRKYMQATCNAACKNLCRAPGQINLLPAQRSGRSSSCPSACVWRGADVQMTLRGQGRQSKWRSGTLACFIVLVENLMGGFD
jgi:hypothetical protein